MADLKRIYDFAVKWRDKFRNWNIDYTELVDHFMADDCAALGFDMDCGQVFSDKYGQAISDYRALCSIINDVNDINLLGSAVYLRCKYFNQLSYDGAVILEPQNRAWFILALSRLALLSGKNTSIFKGTLKRMRIVSNNIHYGSMPEPGEEMEQRITINDEGEVWFSGYNFVNKEEKYEKARTKNFKIAKVSADKLLNAIAAYFANEYVETFETDVSFWTMELTNTEGTTYKFHGSLCADLYYEGMDLSNLVRDIVGMDDLYVFNGNCKTDVINRITLDYHRLTKIKMNEILDYNTLEYVKWDYTEHLIIDGEAETIELIQNVGTGCKISHKYEIEDGIKSLLENFDAEDLFSHTEGNPDDVVENPNEIKDYKITIKYKKNSKRIIEGSFDKKGLPDDFSDFAETVFDFISFYGTGEMFDSSVYGKVKRRKSEHIFCSVIFNSGYKRYYYMTDDDSVEVGDLVIVPAGKNNHEVVAEVVNIEYFTDENFPLPIEKTKRIIRKCTDEDFDRPD